MANQTQSTSVKKLFDLSGKVAVITGGSIGLGRQMAEGLAEMGADVVLCARKRERCEEAAHELAKLGVRTAALGCDVKDPANIQKMVDDSVAQFGRIDILINNAGISWGALVEKMTLEEWNKVIETNLTGTFLCSQAAGKVMIKQGGGKIINVASVAGLRGAPPDTVNAIAYHASKGGVISFTTWPGNGRSTTYRSTRWLRDGSQPICRARCWSTSRNICYHTFRCVVLVPTMI